MLVVATGAAAAQPTAPSDKQKQQAGELVKKAITKSQAGDHDAAIELYLQSYALIPTPILLSNIGSEYQAASKPVDALRYFCKYLDADPTGANVSYATAQAKTLQIQLGNEFDDKNVCKPKEAPPPPQPTPPADSGAGSGSAAPVVGAGESQTGEHPTKTLEYAGLGVGAAGVIAFGVGVYFGLQAKSISDDISNHPMGTPWRNDIQAYEQQGKDDETRGIILMIGGGAAAVTGTVMFVLGRSHGSSNEHVTLRPIATPTTAGLALGGRF